MVLFKELSVRETVPTDSVGSLAIADTAEIDLSLSGNLLFASIFDDAVGEAKLTPEVVAKLALAAASLQTSDIGTTVQPYSDVLSLTTASFGLADEAKLDNITVTSPTNLDQLVSFTNSLDVAELNNITATNPVNLDQLVTDFNNLSGSLDLTTLNNITATSPVNLDQLVTEVNSLTSALVYKGDWDASSGVFPGGGVAEVGWFYYVSVGGTVDGVVFDVGDNIVSLTNNASTTTFANNWSKHDQTDAVQSVAGKVGNVTLVSADITDFQTAVTANVDVTANTAARHNAVTVVGNTYLSVDANQQITAGPINLATDVTGTLTAADISDFQATVSVNSDVVANTAARHNVVTLAGTLDYITIDANQQITRNPINLTTDVTGVLPLTNVANITEADIVDLGTSAALVTDTLNVFAPTTSDQLNSVISDNTGSGALVFASSPNFTGVPTAPTATVGTNTTQLATTAFVNATATAAVSALPTNGLEIATYNAAPTLVPVESTVYLLDTTVNAINVQLPLNPISGTWYGFVDSKGNCSVNNVAIYAATGNYLLDGVKTSLVLNNNHSSVWLAFDDGVWAPITGEFFVNNTAASTTSYYNQTVGLQTLPLTSDGLDIVSVDNILTLQNNTTEAATFAVTAISDDGSLNAHWQFVLSLSRDDLNGGVSVDNVSIIQHYNDFVGVVADNTWVKVSTTHKGVYFEVPGVTGVTVNWEASLPNASVTQVSGGADGSVVEEVQTLSAGGTATMNNGIYNAFDIAVNTDTTIEHSDVPSSGRYSFELKVNWTSGLITWPLSQWTKGDTPPNSVGEYLISGITYDGGSNFIIGVQYL